MKLIMLCLILFIVGCKPDRYYKLKRIKKVDKKYCLEACRAKTFESFHSTGNSWGTGSSSMNGLSQSQIFDRVDRSCKEFYKGEDCCDRFNLYAIGLPTNHGYDYSACDFNSIQDEIKGYE